MDGEPILRHRTAGISPKISDRLSASTEVNPFVHHIDLTLFDKIKIIILTILLLPLRVIGLFSCLLIAYWLACIGTLGLNQQELIEKPMKGWRRKLRLIICWWMRNFFYSGGFCRVSVKGIRASEKEAPILALAPHSSFFDAFPVVVLDAPSLVAKADTQNVPFFAKLINYTQPVYVWREDPNSRQNTVKEIIRRATSESEEWQQILIFPEGTCTNRTGLITFKPGAFYPGVPVQPVCIRYPNRLDTISWTWQGPGAIELLWWTMTQFVTYCELEFLPVYIPNEEEKKDPRLFAANVRDVMAKALGVPVTDYTYEDCRLMNKAKKFGLPPTIGLVGIQQLREEFKLDQRIIEGELMETYCKIADKRSGLVSLKHFAKYLHLPVNHHVVIELFQQYDVDRSEFIDCKKFLRGRCLLMQHLKKMPRPTATLDDLQDMLKVTPAELNNLRSFLTESNPDANENDLMEHLYCAIPEWQWIVSNLIEK